MYKVVIPSAGVGSRSGCTVNKALTTIADKPMIAHVIDHFPDAEEIIVILGFQAWYVKQVLEALYGNRITIMETDTYTKGLGYTLRTAAGLLAHTPFIFCPNDAMFVEKEKINCDPSVYGNWMGYCDELEADLDVTEYRTVEIIDGIVTRINPKGFTLSKNIYTGLCGVKDTEEFWKLMLDYAAIEAGESHGLKALSNIKAIEFESWRDGGGARSLARIKEANPSEFHVLEKPDEAIWFSGQQVIKFSTSTRFIEDRVSRLGHLDPGLLPEVLNWNDNLYTYRRVDGQIISDILDEAMFTRLFDTMQHRVWNHRSSAKYDYYRFYQHKTYDRLGLFFKRDECIDRRETINAVPVPTTWELLQQMNWNELCRRPYVAHYHGDFHNENILVTDDGEFKLLDWRQDFDGDLEFGDVYYDLAKFMHGLIVSHAAVDKGDYRVDRLADGDVVIGIARPENLGRVQKVFVEWLVQNNFDPKRVQILTALVFLNICPLHHYPYSLFLYYLGKRMLTEALS